MCYFIAKPMFEHLPIHVRVNKVYLYSYSFILLWMPLPYHGNIYTVTCTFFPPFNLIDRMLAKLQKRSSREGASGTTVCRAALVHKITEIDSRSACIIPGQATRRHPLPGTHSHARGFRDEFYPPFLARRNQETVWVLFISANGCYFAVNNRQIHFRHL